MALIGTKALQSRTERIRLSLSSLLLPEYRGGACNTSHYTTYATCVIAYISLNMPLCTIWGYDIQHMGVFLGLFCWCFMAYYKQNHAMLEGGGGSPRPLLSYKNLGSSSVSMVVLLKPPPALEK